MKTIVRFINEKLKLGANIQRMPKHGIFDEITINNDIHKYTTLEIVSILTKYKDYSLTFSIFNNLKNQIEVCDYKIYTPGPDSNSAHYAESLELNILFNTTSAPNKETAANIFSKIKDYKHKIFKVGFYDEMSSISRWHYFNTYIVCNIDIDKSAHEIILYLCEERELNSVKSKEKSKQLENDLKSNEEYFNKSNEDELRHDLKMSDNPNHIDFEDIPDNIKYKNSNGEAPLFWKVYATLAIYGDMNKEDVLEMINKLTGSNLVLTSYGTMFTTWNKENRIKKTKGMLSAVPKKDWKI